VSKNVEIGTGIIAFIAPYKKAVGKPPPALCAAAMCGPRTRRKATGRGGQAQGDSMETTFTVKPAAEALGATEGAQLGAERIAVLEAQLATLKAAAGV
jgi:hypothetical protein